MAGNETHGNHEHELLTFCLSGDVMTGRGIDQVLPHPGAPELRESYAKSATEYVKLAEQVHGVISAPVAFSYIWGDALGLLDQLEPAASIVNLETSITVSDDFWPDKAVHYRMHPRNVPCLIEGRVDACALANNHTLDFGRTGLAETLKALGGAGIRHAGAGQNLLEAQKPARIHTRGGGDILLFAFGSTSSGIPPDWGAGSKPGINLLPDLSPATSEAIAAQVRAEKRAGDIAIASIHWGSNWGYEVSSGQIAFAHRLIGAGIDVVHGHSSHHVRPLEIFDGKLILYGCGDLLTDYEGLLGHKSWRGDLGAMYFVSVSRRDGQLRRLRIAPMQMSRMRLTRAHQTDSEWLRNSLNRICEPFGTRIERADGGLLSWQPHHPDTRGK